MKSFFSRCGLAPVACLALVLALPTIGRTQVLTWSNPTGSVTIFGSGSRTTTLQTSATLGSDHAADSLVYLEALSSPATSRSELDNGAASFMATAQLGVDESQTSGLPFVSGNIGFQSSAGGTGSGFGTINLYLLISVPNLAMIDLSGLRSTVTGESSSYSLSLFQSNAAGEKIGNALLNYTGDHFDESASYRATGPYYLLETKVSANASPGAFGSAEFSYLLDLQPIAVPEPGSFSLLMAAAVVGGVFLRSTRRRAKSVSPSILDR